MTLRILHVEDNPVHARLARAAVESAHAGWQLTSVATLASALAAPTPDLVLLDLDLPDSHGLETLLRLRERLAPVPVVLLTATEDAGIEERALELGAQDFLGKDELSLRTLRRVIRYAIERHRAQQELIRLSTRDELTGMYNRRGFFAAAEHHLRVAERARRPFFVLYADVDGLKGINDTLGHAAGDEAIRDAAWVLRSTFRAADIVARLGGDEFAVLAVDAPAESVSLVLDRLAFLQAQRNAESGRAYSLSLSAGVATPTVRESASLEQLLAAADAAAYRRKRERGTGATVRG